jgi:hypothetical protein
MATFHHPELFRKKETERKIINNKYLFFMHVNMSAVKRLFFWPFIDLEPFFCIPCDRWDSGLYLKGTWQRGGFSGVFAEIGSA